MLKHRVILRAVKFVKTSKIWIIITCFFILFCLSRSRNHQTNQQCSTQYNNSALIYTKEGKPQCTPLEISKFFLNTNDIATNFMKTLDKPRKLMSFLHEPKNILSLPGQCKSLEDKVKLKLVFFVKSSLANFDRRKAIRETWGSVHFLDAVLIKIVFIVGTSGDNIVNRNLTREINSYRDILQMDLVDTSRTVSEKVLAGMQWSSQNLPFEWLYASMDDDIVIYLGNLVNYLNGMLLFKTQPSSWLPPCVQDFPLACVYNFQKNDSPNRFWFSKWYISSQQFSGSYWPPYCRGGLYLMSNKLNSEIFEMSRSTPSLSMDDVWITGIMRRKLKMGDCNIMPAPYSQKPDFFLLSWFHDDGGDKALMKHLWGNTQFYSVDPAVQMHLEWDEWKKRTGWNNACVS